MLQINLTTENAGDVLLAYAQNDCLTDQLQEACRLYGLPTGIVQDFAADMREVLPVYAADRRVYLLGLGKNPQMRDYTLAYRSFFHQYRHKLGEHITLDMRTHAREALEWAVNGAKLASYNLHFNKTGATTNPHFFERAGEISLLTAEGQAEQEVARHYLQRGEAIADTQLEIFQLVNLPANQKPPKVLADWATASAQKYGYKATILDKETLEREGLHALLGVNAGSPESPYLIVLEYKPAEALPKVGLVGKGVTFDTGGISIKDHNNMHFMKCDMAGAGGVLGAFEACVKLGIQKHLIAVVPATPNTVDGNAMKPSDVIGSYAGKTIEVIDTDAEGRIILADGLAYLNRNFQPDYLIDMATLTGSCVATLGYAAAGLFTQNDELASKLTQSATYTGEKLWRLPMWDDYKGDISSDVADVRNYSGKSIAGAISAAKFLEVFTENHPCYAHIDMAGVSYVDSEFATMRSATAYGVRLLVDFIEKL